MNYRVLILIVSVLTFTAANVRADLGKTTGVSSTSGNCRDSYFGGIGSKRLRLLLEANCLGTLPVMKGYLKGSSLKEADPKETAFLKVLNKFSEKGLVHPDRELNEIISNADSAESRFKDEYGLSKKDAELAAAYLREALQEDKNTASLAPKDTARESVNTAR